MTTGTYIPQVGDTIFSIAQKVGRGACDIARFNRLADAELITPGLELLIPAQVCSPDSSTCLLNMENTTSTCVLGGPHTYTTAVGDTLEKIALYKLGITLQAILSTTMGITNITATIPAGTTIKVPQCSPSQCNIMPYEFTYGVYKDIADSVACTVGQLFAFNPTHNSSH